MATLAQKLKKERVRKNLSMSDVARRSMKIIADPRGRITQGYMFLKHCNC